MSEDAKHRILALLRKQEEAIARGDAAPVVAGMADDIVTYDMPPPLEYRGQAARDPAGLEQWFETWDGQVIVTMPDPTVIIEGNLAVVFGLSRMRGTKKEGGPVDAWNRRTVVLRLIADDWKVIHEHSSYPMAMDGSGRAMTDLKP